MSGLFSFVNPKITFGLIRTQLEKQLKKKIDFYKILFKDNKLYFIVDGKKYEYENTKLCFLLSENIKKELNENQIFDFIIINIGLDNQDSQIYYTENNEKLFINQIL